MTRTITRVTSTRRGYVVNWRGEKDIDLFIAKPADAPRVGDVITFRDAPAAGKLSPKFAIKRRKGGNKWTGSYQYPRSL